MGSAEHVRACKLGPALPAQFHHAPMMNAIAIFLNSLRPMNPEPLRSNMLNTTALHVVWRCDAAQQYKQRQQPLQRSHDPVLAAHTAHARFKRCCRVPAKNTNAPCMNSCEAQQSRITLTRHPQPQRHQARRTRHQAARRRPTTHAHTL